MARRRLTRARTEGVGDGPGGTSVAAGGPGPGRIDLPEREGPRPWIGQILLDLDLIGPDALVEALREQQEQRRDGLEPERLGEILLRLGRADEPTILRALGDQLGVGVADLRRQRPEVEAVEAVSEELARRLGVLPVRHLGDRLVVAVPDVTDRVALETLAAAVAPLVVEPVLATRGEIERALNAHFDALRGAEGVITAFELASEEEAPEVEEVGVDENAPVVQVVSRILTQAVREGTSDVHIEPMADHVRVRFRVDGALTEAIRLPRRMGAPVASRIKVLADLNIVERRRPQDGQFSVQVEQRQIDVRTSIVPTVHGEKVVLRLLDTTRSLISLEHLGMSPMLLTEYRKVTSAPLGMLLCTGPTGSGKTTTLYASLAEVDAGARNLVTIEDPVEYQFPGVNQIQINEAAGLGFANGLRSVLRQDPDVILVGEIRDVETARISVQAALTGHLVLSSLHAVDAAAALHRFLDMGIEPFLVASAVTAVLGQRLVRRTCGSCAEEYAPPVDHQQLVAERTGLVPSRWMRGVGCYDCNGSGFRGRIGVYEFLRIDDELRELTVAKAPHTEIRRAAVAAGMRTMQDEAFSLVAHGVTTVDEVLRAVYVL